MTLRFILITWLILTSAISVGLIIAQDTDSESKISSLIWNENSGKVGIGFQDGMVKIYELSSTSIVNEFQSSLTSITSMDWSPSGDKIALGGPGGFVEIWQLSPLSVDENFQTPNGSSISLVQWSPDGNYLITTEASGPANFNIWSITDKLFILSERIPTIPDATWSNSKQTLALGYLYTHVDLRDSSDFLTTGYIGLSMDEVRATFNQITHLIVRLAWSPDDRYLLTGATGGEVTLWEVRNNTIVSQNQANDLDPEDSNNSQLLNVRDVWFSVDGTSFNSLAIDGTYRSWDTETGALLVDFNLGSKVPLVEISPDKTRLAYVDESNELHIVALHELLTEQLNLTITECIADGSLQQQLNDTLTSEIEGFVSQVEANHDTFTDETCADELLGLAEALQDTPEP